MALPDAGIGTTITLVNLDGIPIAVTVDALVDPAEGTQYSPASPRRQDDAKESPRLSG